MNLMSAAVANVDGPGLAGIVRRIEDLGADTLIETTAEPPAVVRFRLAPNPGSCALHLRSRNATAPNPL